MFTFNIKHAPHYRYSATVFSSHVNIKTMCEIQPYSPEDAWKQETKGKE